MPSSAGAVSAAQPGRSNRITEADSQDYQLILRALPTDSTVLHTVFLHADVRARAYRVENFRDNLLRLALLPEVVALGAYQMNHVWAITFKSEEGKKKILTASDVKLKEHRCVVIDSSHQDTRLTLHWLLHTVHDDEVKAALSPYGKVTEVSREEWRVQG